MALTKCKLGEHLELIERPNTNLQYGIDDVRGVNNLKLMIRTKADVSARNFDKFQIVLPGEFFFNHRTSRNGDKFSVTFNYDNEPHIVTEDYVVFAVKDDHAIDPMWLYMYLSRPEFDRYVIQNSWGSSTEFYNWEDLCDVDMLLPSFELQKTYAAVYSAMWRNQLGYDRGLDDLKLTCDAYIEKLLHTMPKTALGPHLILKDNRNEGRYGIDAVRGISTGKELTATKADLNGVSLKSYKIVGTSEIAYVADTSRRGNKISLGMNNTDEPCLVSSISIVFATRETLDPNYLMLMLSRAEFDRYARFNSWGSARETFTWEDMQEVKLPIPSIEMQKSIAHVYASLVERRQINEQLKALSRRICPILIKGSLDEARR